MIVIPSELQAVKDALTADPHNLGVGVLHEPTGRIHLAPFDLVPGGPADLAGRFAFPLVECKGFVVSSAAAGGSQVINHSHLNGPQGQPGSLQMPQSTFGAIVQALTNCGL
jgi:hypothetical protein